jgi:hypothetical protein
MRDTIRKHERVSIGMSSFHRHEQKSGRASCGGLRDRTSSALVGTEVVPKDPTSPPP